MRILNFGSINIDYVYRVPHFVRPGETLDSQSLDRVLGGKGANQSIALARAGASVLHLGRVAEADSWAVDILKRSTVDTTAVAQVETPSGHAVIQVDDKGENAIVLYGGANREFTEDTIDKALAALTAGDWLLLQNECNHIGYAVKAAAERNIRIAFNPAPMTDAVRGAPLEKLDLLIVNQIEAQQLSGKTDFESALTELTKMAPSARIVLTLGKDGALSASEGKRIQAAAPKVEAVDSTGAGDTFVGYYLAALVEGMSDDAALKLACRAAAAAVTRLGASTGIPTRAEVDQL